MMRIVKYIRTVPFVGWLIAGFVLFEIALSRLPAVLSWDGSVYAGMGKYLYSLGAIGLWETLRPVGLPVILGLAWKLGFDPYVFGQYVAIAGAALCVYFAYRIGEVLHRGAGVFSAVLLAMTPLFLTYASIPMTDIISSAFALGSVNAVIRARGSRGYAAAGFFAGLAFLFRFPHGLVFLVSGGIVLMREGRRIFSPERRAAFLRVLAYGAGFLVLAAPFFVVNWIAYGDPLLPLRAGSSIIKNLPELYYQAPLFYFSSLYHANKLVVFIFVPVVAGIVFWRAPRQGEARARYLAVFLYLALYLGYFTYLDHKELRYSLAFLPMAMTVAGAGLGYLADRMGGKRLTSILLAACIMLAAISAWRIAHEASRGDQIYDSVGVSLREYAARKASTPILLSASPFPAAVSDAQFAATLYDDWREVGGTYEAHKEKLSHVLIDTCTLETVCRFDAGCTDGRDEALRSLMEDMQIVADGSVGSCRVTLYERI